MDYLGVKNWFKSLPIPFCELGLIVSIVMKYHVTETVLLIPVELYSKPSICNKFVSSVCDCLIYLPVLTDYPN